MAKFIKPFQSEGGFSVAEESIIDEERNILKANSVQVVNSLFANADKQEFISFNRANDTNTTVNLEDFTDVAASTVLFSHSNVILTWKGYVIAQYSANAASSIATISLNNHGFEQGDSITIAFDASGSGSDGTYTVSEVVDDSVFRVDTGIVFDPAQSIIGGTLEITSLGLYWEYSTEISTTCLSDSSNNLTLAGISKTILKDNVPLGQEWIISPTVNNTEKTFGYQVQITSNGTLENQGAGVECVAFITNVSAIRD